MTVFKVILYCPDRHITYDGNTPYESGIGGGVTARIRMARALAEAGQEVSMVCNCPEHQHIDGVEYIPLDGVQPMAADVLMANTSGGEYGLGPLLDLPVTAQLSLLWMSGIAPPANLDQVTFDGVYAKSNFLLDLAQSEWGILAEKMWVFYNGFEENLYAGPASASRRRDHRLVYSSHPSKGLDTAIDITQRLRAVDERFHLVVCGGEALWGRPVHRAKPVPGVEDMGLLPQNALIDLLYSSTYSLALQSRPEPFGMVVTESQRAGCVVLASPVGAFPELVQDGVNGLMIEGEHQADAVRQIAAEAIFELSLDPARLEAIQQQARRVPWSSSLMAKAWVQHWELLVGGEELTQEPCPQCRGRGWRLADGIHCLSCRRYSMPSIDRDEPL